MPDLPVYDLFAIRYATRAGKRSDHFIGGDPHDGPMPMDDFVWAAVSGGNALDCAPKMSPPQTVTCLPH